MSAEAATMAVWQATSTAVAIDSPFGPVGGAAGGAAARGAPEIPLAKRRLVLAMVLAAHGVALALALTMKVAAGADQAPGVLQAFWLTDENSVPALQPEPAVKPKPLPMQPPRAAAPERREKSLVTIAASTPTSSSVPTVEPQATDAAPSRPEDAAVSQGSAAASTRQTGAAPVSTAPSFEADYLSNPAPAYPPLSRQLREQGLVSLRIQVTAEGHPETVVLQHGSGFERLDKAALDVVWRWRFVPARHGGENVAGWVIVPIRFILRS